MISMNLWRTQFHSGPNIVRSVVRVNRQQLTIISVTPAAFHGMARALDHQMWIPLMMAPQLNRIGNGVLSSRRTRRFNAIARLKDGVSVEQARASGPQRGCPRIL